MNFRQVLAIARYEMLMAFRRRTLVIIGILTLVSIAVFTRIALDANRSYSAIARYEGSVITSNEDEEVLLLQALPAWLEGIDLDIWTGGAVMVTTLVTTMLVVTMSLVLFVSEVIPLDGLYRVRELLGSLPLTRSSYLLGKVLGVCFGLLVIMAVGIALSAVWFRVNFVYDFRYFLLLWGVIVMPVVLISGAVSVLLASWLTSRRIAILFSLFVIPCVLYVAVTAITTLTGIGVYLHPSYAYYAYTVPEFRSAEVVTVQIVFTIVRFIVLLVFVWTIAWAWQRFREAR